MKISDLKVRILKQFKAEKTWAKYYFLVIQVGKGVLILSGADNAKKKKGLFSHHEALV